MNKASVSIIVAIPILWGWSLFANAAQPYSEEPSKEPERTKLLSIVRDKDSFMTMMNSNEWQDKKLDEVKTKADSLKFIDRRVKLVGKYVVKIWNPGINSNTAEFKGTYKQASIELADGSLISLIQPYNKLSLRSATEVETYAGKLVEVVGYIQLQPDNPLSKNSSQSVMLTSLDRIRLKH
jgi:hypothetical protein